MQNNTTPRPVRKYHVVLERATVTTGDNTNLWYPQFGDFDRNTVKDELKDYRRQSIDGGTSLEYRMVSVDETDPRLGSTDGWAL